MAFYSPNKKPWLSNQSGLLYLASSKLLFQDFKQPRQEGAATE